MIIKLCLKQNLVNKEGMEKNQVRGNVRLCCFS